MPLFKRAENNEQIVNEYHGQGGSLNVTYPRFESEATERFLKAAALNGKVAVSVCCAGALINTNRNAATLANFRENFKIGRTFE